MAEESIRREAITMTRVNILCEGQTEETFVREVLYNHFMNLDTWLNPILLRTSKHGRGGAVSYGKIKHQAELLCKQDRNAFVTTFIDFSKLPSDFPLIQNQRADRHTVDEVELAFQNDIGEPNFIANIISYEFEGLLFSDPNAFGDWFDDRRLVARLVAIRSQFASPEDINDGVTTAPSKRILNILKGYDKVSHGSLVALGIGLDTIRRECPRFNAWIDKLEKL
ncbi:MAG: DUF4276 family protein [Balneolales bacterium]|nr:DUF4276 family protein [Balneolales bacterium]